MLWLPIESTKEDLQERRQQLIENAKNAGIENVTEDDIGVIVIGATGPFREFDDESAAEYYEDRYVELARKNRADSQPTYSYERFRSEYSGWTSVTPLRIHAIGKVFIWALVPRTIVSDIEFSSGVTTFLLGDTDDLVAARSNSDGMYYVYKLLCPDDEDFYACDSRYDSDFFDQLTGQELYSNSLKVVDYGVLIDLETFKPIAKEDKSSE